MEKEVQVTFTLLVDNEQLIDKGDFFYYPQSTGIASIRKCREKQNGKSEDWNGYQMCLSGENPYSKIIGYKGIVLHLKELNQSIK